MKRFWLLLLLVIGIGFGGIRSASAHGIEAGQLSVLIDNVNAGDHHCPVCVHIPLC